MQQAPYGTGDLPDGLTLDPDTGDIYGMPTVTEEPVTVAYRGHVQNVGDLPTESAAWYTDGEKLGTVGSALRLEALLVKVVKNETDLTASQTLCESIKNQED